MPPTFGNGKICYIEIPALDIATSSSFYQQAFGWSLRHHGDGTVAFDDTIGEVSGMWTLKRPPASTPGFIISIMVDSVAATCETITALGGKIVQPIGGGSGEITAHFRDPAGNILGIYQHPA